jgi:hypothetical protein
MLHELTTTKMMSTYLPVAYVCLRRFASFTASAIFASFAFLASFSRFLYSAFIVLLADCATLSYDFCRWASPFELPPEAGMMRVLGLHELLDL